MTTIGWVMILMAMLIIRQIFKGRVKDIGSDMSDAFIALVSGDTKGLTAVFARTADAGTADVVASDPMPAQNSATGLLAAAVALGSGKKYVFGSAGPDTYDCSGLVYRAAQKIGYTGSRFYTGNFAITPSTANFWRSVPQGQAGDVVLWRTQGHMGVVSGPDKFYSARNPRDGIGYDAISSFESGGPKPTYWRHS